MKKITTLVAALGLTFITSLETHLAHARGCRTGITTKNEARITGVKAAGSRSIEISISAFSAKNSKVIFYIAPTETNVLEQMAGVVTLFAPSNPARLIEDSSEPDYFRGPSLAPKKVLVTSSGSSILLNLTPGASYKIIAATVDCMSTYDTKVWQVTLPQSVALEEQAIPQVSISRFFREPNGRVYASVQIKNIPDGVKHLSYYFNGDLVQDSLEFIAFNRPWGTATNPIRGLVNAMVSGVAMSDEEATQAHTLELVGTTPDGQIFRFVHVGVPTPSSGAMSGW